MMEKKRKKNVHAPEDEARLKIKSVSDILREDRRRMKKIATPVDPISGFNSVGKRFLLRVADYEIPEMYLPVEMRDYQLVRRLEEAGSFGKIRKDTETIPGLQREFQRIRMKCDFPYWAAVAVNIKKKGGGGDIKFVLNRPQCKLVEVFERMRLANLPIRIILLKARQWGGSTCVQIYMSWLQLMHSIGLNSLIIAHQQSGTDEIKDMFDRMLDAYPQEWLESLPDNVAPVTGRGGRLTENVGRGGSAVRVMCRNCKIKLGTAERPDSCRGGDYNLVHLSEVGLWPSTPRRSAEDIVRSACGGVLLAPLTMIVYESTANGTGNFFHREYLAASRGESQFSPLFIAWFEIERYSLSLTDKERKAFASKLWEERELYSASDRSEPGQYLWNLFLKGATLGAIAWYVEERRKYNDHARMASEYPSDDYEAFAHSGQPVFNREYLLELRKSCRSPKFRGEVEMDSPQFRILAGGGMSVWEMPEDSCRMTDRYLVVVDVGGRTARADWSVITVIDRKGMVEGGRLSVVAQWRGHCDWDILARKAVAIARFYHDALLAFESNSLESKDYGVGADGGQLPFILHQIKDEYDNLYVRQADIDDVRGGGGTRIGFHTNVSTKPMVIATLIRAVREGLYEEPCDEAVNEMESYERRQNGSYGAIAGCHDDILMTRAIGLYIALYEMDTPRPRPIPGYTSRQRVSRRIDPMTEACF